LADGEAKPDAEKNPEEAVVEQSRVPRVRIETRIEAGTSLRQPQNWTIRFPELNHPVSTAPG
jgi:hypothetical protein